MTKPKVIAIIQARMGSTRFPGKMLHLLAGKPLVHHVLDRVRKAHHVDDVILATSDHCNNLPLIEEVKKKGFNYFVGSENDVLDRYYQCAKRFGADVIVRITGDCPLIDPEIIDKTIELFNENHADYASNGNPDTFPDGMDFDMFTFQSLEKAWNEAKLHSEREHVTPYIWKNKNLFKQVHLHHHEDLSNLRFTVDEKEDLTFLNELLLRTDCADPKLHELVHTIRTYPELMMINNMFARNEGYAKSLREDAICKETHNENNSNNNNNNIQNTNNANTHNSLPKIHIGKSQQLYEKAKKLIPGGTQLLSKRPELFLPHLWPAYYEKAKGCSVWDLDGNEYLDLCYMGIGTSILGYADDDVDVAVKSAIDRSTKSTLNCPEEVELAEVLCDLHPWAENVRFARTGGEAVAIAVRIARAKTGKDIILFCGYHGWHDWYISTNLASDTSLDGHLLPGLEPKGVPRSLQGTSIPFHYNDIDEFVRLVQTYQGKIAAVVMEPLRGCYPQPGFLEKIRHVTQEHNIVLVFDEVSSGFRLTLGGAHLNLGVNPDVAVFAKAMGNGYPIAAIIGKRIIMEAAQESFISSSFWTERIGFTAALATIAKLKENNIPSHLNIMGKKVQDGWKCLAEKYGLKISVVGIYPLSSFSFLYEKPLVLKTLFTQIMLQKGFLATTAYFASYAHKDEHITKYLSAVDEAFNFIANAVTEGNPKKYLQGPVCHSGFARLT
ncbi:hypothetical protein COV17_00205 [Candidatus Woesearchaeota archaeon CG10_big_fil_rev_8_21_14_0_10_36_11]|nr:MAG: hypothetical protein COV17_00205 [Candidatus Woesearchaeota archaeon CG10_big_fil_rev_8_21_14_0_10_36_11]